MAFPPPIRGENEDFRNIDDSDAQSGTGSLLGTWTAVFSGLSDSRTRFGSP
jgi:hypothetical protein